MLRKVRRRHSGPHQQRGWADAQPKDEIISVHDYHNGQHQHCHQPQNSDRGTPSRHDGIDTCQVEEKERKKKNKRKKQREKSQEKNTVCVAFHFINFKLITRSFTVQSVAILIF